MVLRGSCGVERGLWGGGSPPRFVRPLSSSVPFRGDDSKPGLLVCSPDCWLASRPPGLPAWLVRLACPLACWRACIAAWLPGGLVAWLPAGLPACPPVGWPADRLACPPGLSAWPARWPAGGPACRPASRPSACRPVCLHAIWLGCRLAGALACWLGCMAACLPGCLLSQSTYSQHPVNIQSTSNQHPVNMRRETIRN